MYLKKEKLKDENVDKHHTINKQQYSILVQQI